jgi:hypothetical protein
MVIEHNNYTQQAPEPEATNVTQTQASSQAPTPQPAPQPASQETAKQVAEFVRNELRRFGQDLRTLEDRIAAISQRNREALAESLASTPSAIETLAESLASAAGAILK